MNPAALFKIMQAKNKVSANHPKFMAFCKQMFFHGVEEGTIIEVTVTKPGQEPVTSNLKVLPEDLELFNSLKDLKL